MHENILETRTRRHFCARTSKRLGAKQLGSSGAGSFDFNSQTIWQNNQRVHVCGSNVVQCPRRGNQHLFDLQTDFSKTSSQRHQIHQRNLQERFGSTWFQSYSSKYGRNCFTRNGRSRRQSHCEFVSIQGLYFRFAPTSELCLM